MNGQVELSTPMGLIRRNEFVPGATLHELVEQHEIPVHKQPTVCIMNGTPVLRKDWGTVVCETDEVVFIAMPLGGNGGLKGILRLVALVALAVVAPYAAGAIGGLIGVSSQIGLGLIQAGVMIAGAFLINALLGPKAPSSRDSEQSPTYSLGAQGNQARLLQPIPRLYGRHMIYPDFASQPFADYENNEQYLYQLFCLGVGEYSVEKVRIEETDLWTSSAGYTGNFDDVTIELVPPGQPVSLIPLEVKSSSEVGGQELKNWEITGSYTFAGNTITRASGENFERFVPGDVIIIAGAGANNGSRTINNVAPDFQSCTVNGSAFTALTGTKTIALDDWVGPYVAVDAGQQADKLAVDITFPQGLGYANDSGSISNHTISIEVQARPIDLLGNPLGSFVVLGSHTYTMRTQTAQRRTELYEVTPGRYEVRVRRTTERRFSSRYLDLVQWAGLRAYIPDDATFPDVTLMAVKIRATDQLTQQSSRKFNVIQTAKVPIWNGTSWSAPTATRNPAWAAADMLRNTVYGEGYPDSRIDLAKLLSLANTWTSRGDKFDAVFDTKQSLWDALGSVLRAGRAQPVMVAGIVTFVRDEPRSIARGVFTPRNIVKNSFETTHVLYDENAPDDVIVEYIDERTWKQSEVQCALPGSLSEAPARIQIFGVVDRTQAWREGMYQAASNAYRRTFAKLTTELEGRLLIKGDPVVVSHDVPQWAQSSEVVDREGLTLYLSEAPEFTPGETHYVVLRKPNGGEFGPILCTASGVASDAVVLDADDLAAAEGVAGMTLAQVVNLDPNRELTLCVFGVGLTSMRRFLLTSGTPRGLERVELTLVNDDSRVYTADVGTPPAEVSPVGPGAVPGAPVASNLNVLQDPNSGPNPVLVNASWPAAAGALQYLLQVSYDNVVWTTVYQGSTPAAQVTIQPGLVYFRLAAVNVFRGPWAVFSGSFGAATAQPSTPTDLLVDVSTTQGVIDISWTAGARALSYTVKLYVETTPGSGVYDLLKISRTTSATAIQFTSADVQAAGGPWAAFKVEVSSVNASGTSAPASYVSLGYTLATPANLALIAAYRGRDLSATWTAVANAATYEVEVSARGVVLDTFQVATTSITITEAQLQDYGGPWYSLVLRVRAKNQTLYSSYASLTVRILSALHLWNFENNDGADSVGTSTLTLSGATTPSVGGTRGRVYRGAAATDKGSSTATLTASYTKAVWINPSTLTGTKNILSVGTTGASHVLYISTAELRGGQNGVNNLVTYTLPAAGVWRHVALTYDAPTTTMKLYVDGTLVSTNTSAAAIASGSSVLVGNTGGGTIGFIGDLDEVQLYGRALTAIEVKALMQ